jgi:hypothetical protein
LIKGQGQLRDVVSRKILPAAVGGCILQQGMGGFKADGIGNNLLLIESRPIAQGGMTIIFIEVFGDIIQVVGAIVGIDRF